MSFHPFLSLMLSFIFSLFFILWWGTLYFTQFYVLTMQIIGYLYNQYIFIKHWKDIFTMVSLTTTFTVNGNCENVAISPKMKVSFTWEKYNFFLTWLLSSTKCTHIYPQVCWVPFHVVLIIMVGSHCQKCKGHFLVQVHLCWRS